MAAHRAVILKAETLTDKTEWVTKIKSIVGLKESATKRPTSEDVVPVRQDHSDGSPVSCNRFTCF